MLYVIRSTFQNINLNIPLNTNTIIMKSPITGKEMFLKREHRNLIFRKEEYDIVYHYFLCEDTKEQFTIDELDELNLTQLYNKYRESHNLPFPDEIIETRQKYKLSATKMSEILGFGINVYRNYEAGEVPNESNARLIQLASDPAQFKELLLKSRISKEKEIKKYITHIDELIENKSAAYFKKCITDNYLLGITNPNKYTGYKKQSLEKFTAMVIFFSKMLKPWKTYLNKYLFYADFLNYKKTGFAISGLQYRAIDMGPVPNNFNSIYEYLATEDFIDIEQQEFTDGKIGERFFERKDNPFDPEIFTSSELESLNTVVKNFKDLEPKKIIDISHSEEAWEKYFKDGKKLIDYNSAFDLKAL